MEAYVLVIFLGVLLLFVPQAAWLGFAFLAIGLVTYFISVKQPMGKNLGQPKYLPSWPQIQQAPQSTGISWTTKDFKQQGDKVSAAQDPFSQPAPGPEIKDGMFSLPLPISGDVGRFVNLKYKSPTQATGVTQQKEKKGNPWLPKY